MSHVPLIPFQRPVPQAFLRPALSGKSAKVAKPKKQKKVKMAVSKKKARFEATNTDDIKQMPSDVQRLWRILERMDPEGDIFVNDKGILVLDGEGPDERRPEAIKLRKDDTDLLKSYAVLDGPKANDPETATGLIFTQFQMIQLAYELGRQAEQRKVATDFKKAITSPPPVGDYDEDEDDEDDEDEEFDDDMDVVDEDDDDDDSEDDNNDNEEPEDDA
jgi:hypothetical protein